MHPHHAVHEVGANERVAPGLAGRDIDVDRLTAIDCDSPVLDLGLVISSNLRRGEELRSAEVVAFCAAIGEMQVIGDPRCQVERGWGESIVGKRHADRLCGLRQRRRQRSDGHDRNSTCEFCHKTSLNCDSSLHLS